MDRPDILETGAEGAGLLHIRLSAFDGPLDLLLHLVRKRQLDIQQVSLAELTEPYLAYLRRIRELNLDVAGEFLSIAATLIWIKSKSLLPRDVADDEPDPEEAEALLIERLKEYQRIKDAAARLTGLDLLGRDLFPRQVGPPDEAAEVPPGVPAFEAVSLFELIEAFRGVLEQSRESPAMTVAPRSESIEERIGALLDRFAERRVLAFHELFSAGAERSELVLAFISLLELVRLKAIRVTQGAPQGEILCRATEHFGESGADWKALVLAALFGGSAPGPTAEPDGPAAQPPL